MRAQSLAENVVREHVGVGEIFIVAGQSNSANYGSEKQTTAGRLASFDGTTWHLGNDPQRGAGGSGGSFMPAFGDALAKRFDVPIGVMPCGVGSTSVREWLPGGAIVEQQPTTGNHVKSDGAGKWIVDGRIFDSLIKRIAHFGPHGFRAVLWHQGESDAGHRRARVIRLTARSAANSIANIWNCSSYQRARKRRGKFHGSSLRFRITANRMRPTKNFAAHRRHCGMRMSRSKDRTRMPCARRSVRAFILTATDCRRTAKPGLKKWDYGLRKN